MEDFIVTYPAVIISIIAFLFGLVNFVLMIIGWMIRQSVNKLNLTMQAIVNNSTAMDKRLIVQEVNWQNHHARYHPEPRG